MPVVGPKYSDTPEYKVVLALLIEAVIERRSPITYADVFSAMGLESGNHAAQQAGHLLGEISESMHAKGRPLLTAIVVNKKTGLPGSGFFDLAVALGKLPIGADDQAKHAFWETECTAISATDWTRSLRFRLNKSGSSSHR